MKKLSLKTKIILCILLAVPTIANAINNKLQYDKDIEQAKIQMGIIKSIEK